MKIITQLVILTLLLLLVNALDDQYCSNLFRDFKNNCPISEINIHSENCCDLRSFLASGVYKINKGGFDSFVKAYCDMNTANGGWIVIQRNKRSSLVNFNRNWTDYEKGFGDLNTEFWYGLEELHCLTQRGQWEMRLDYQFFNKTWSYLHYTKFSVGSANDEYPLTIGGFTGMNADWFQYPSYSLSGRKFSTPDNDNDERNNYNCADVYNSGWWYHNDCHQTNVNLASPRVRYSVLFTEMKIRPKDCIIQ